MIDQTPNRIADAAIRYLHRAYLPVVFLFAIADACDDSREPGAGVGLVLFGFAGVFAFLLLTAFYITLVVLVIGVVL